MDVDLGNNISMRRVKEIDKWNIQYPNEKDKGSLCIDLEH